MGDPSPYPFPSSPGSSAKEPTPEQEVDPARATPGDSSVDLLLKRVLGTMAVAGTVFIAAVVMWPRETVDVRAFVPTTQRPTTTVSPQTMTIAEMNAIEAGMTLDDVIAIVGGPPMRHHMCCTDLPNSPQTHWYQWTGAARGDDYWGNYVQVEIKEGHVTGTERHGILTL